MPSIQASTFIHHTANARTRHSLHRRHCQSGSSSLPPSLLTPQVRRTTGASVRERPRGGKKRKETGRRRTQQQSPQSHIVIVFTHVHGGAETRHAEQRSDNPFTQMSTPGSPGVPPSPHTTTTQSTPTEQIHTTTPSLPLFPPRKKSEKVRGDGRREAERHDRRKGGGRDGGAGGEAAGGGSGCVCCCTPVSRSASLFLLGGTRAAGRWGEFFGWRVPRDTGRSGRRPLPGRR